MVDGAHAVGSLDLDVPSLQVDFYTANLHKWLCTPKGTAFLWVAPQHQAGLRPLVLSHGTQLVSISALTCCTVIFTLPICASDYACPRAPHSCGWHRSTRLP